MKCPNCGSLCIEWRGGEDGWWVDKIESTRVMRGGRIEEYRCTMCGWYERKVIPILDDWYNGLEYE